MVFMVNADAAFDCHTGIAGLGMVIRDENGNVIVSAVAKIYHFLNPFLVE